MTGGDLSDLPDDRLVAMMARHLKTCESNRMGSVPWVHAVLGFEACKREMDRRMIEHVVEAAKERDGDPD